MTFSLTTSKLITPYKYFDLFDSRSIYMVRRRMLLNSHLSLICHYHQFILYYIRLYHITAHYTLVSLFFHYNCYSFMNTNHTISFD